MSTLSAQSWAFIQIEYSFSLFRCLCSWFEFMSLSKTTSCARIQWTEQFRADLPLKVKKQHFMLSFILNPIFVDESFISNDRFRQTCFHFELNKKKTVNLSVFNFNIDFACRFVDTINRKTFILSHSSLGCRPF